MYFTLSSGMELYYEDTQYGDEVLLMLHGVTSNHTVFSQPAEILKGKVRCIFYDQRGHLNSRYANKEPVTMETLADDLNEIINGLSLKNVNLLGWSMGAGVIMTYVKKYGCGALKQVILCDMTPRQLNDESWQLGLDRGRYTADVVRKMESKSFKVVVREFARLIELGFKPKNVIHLGKRGSSPGFLKDYISGVSNIGWFKSEYSEDNWSELIDVSRKEASEKALSIFKRRSNIRGAREEMERTLSARVANSDYFGMTDEGIDKLKQTQEVILNSIKKPRLILESAAFVWMVKRDYE